MKAINDIFLQQKLTLHVLQISGALTLLKPEVRKKGDIALEQI